MEDEPLIVLALEDVLLDAGFEVGGVAGSQAEALRIAAATRPSFAVVDVQLFPGDGLFVARELVRRYGTAVLMATSCSQEVEVLAATGALACLPKPYDIRDVPAALRGISDLRDGRPGPRFPANMFSLRDLEPMAA